MCPPVASQENFARFVALACHDLRTPLATIGGFAHTLERAEELAGPQARYVGMMREAAEQMGGLLDTLGLVARIESGRYEPAFVDVDSLELATAAAERLGEKASAGGSGDPVRVDREAVEAALAALALCAVRHGGIDHVEITAVGPTVEIGPVVSRIAVAADEVQRRFER